MILRSKVRVPTQVCTYVHVYLLCGLLPYSSSHTEALFQILPQWFNSGKNAGDRGPYVISQELLTYYSYLILTDHYNIQTPGYTSRATEVE